MISAHAAKGASQKRPVKLAKQTSDAITERWKDHSTLHFTPVFMNMDMSTIPTSHRSMVESEPMAAEKPVKIIQMSHISAESHGRASAVYADNSTNNTFNGGIHHHKIPGKWQAIIFGLVL
jgi:hypothetical protein